jgi:hypothetical protein
MSKDKPFMGVINRWHKDWDIPPYDEVPNLGYVVIGTTNDHLDGYIRTSYVVEIQVDIDQNLWIETLNSVYKLGSRKED